MPTQLTTTAKSKALPFVVDDVNKRTRQRLIVSSAFVVIPILFTVIWIWSGLTPFKWDAAWYRSIANSGYQFDGNITRQQNVAFLPGYPIAIYLFHLLTGLDSAWCQYLASVTSYLIGSAYFYKAFQRWFSPTQSALIVLFFSMNPFAIYLFNGYSEALLYLLCGVFFFGIASGRLWLSSIALSLGLITRPHAAFLYPVLLYVLAKRHGLKWDKNVGFRVDGGRIKAFFQSTVDYSFLVSFFPAALTIYWYLKFSDPFVYANALVAWNGGGMTGAQGQFRFLLQHLTHFYTVTLGKVAGFPIMVASPDNVAAWNVMLNMLALIFLVLRNRFEFALFCAGLLVFWFLKSDPGNAGRHALLLLALPIMLASALLPSAPAQHAPLKATTTTTTSVGCWMFRVAVAGFLLLNLMHFVAYAVIQLGGGWIS